MSEATLTGAFTSGTVMISGHGGASIEAYTSLVADPAPRGGVVVIHHLPGYDDATKEIVRRFGHLGYNAVMPNLYWHDAPGAAPDDAAAELVGPGAAVRRRAARAVDRADADGPHCRVRGQPAADRADGGGRGRGGHGVHLVRDGGDGGTGGRGRGCHG